MVPQSLSIFKRCREAEQRDGIQETASCRQFRNWSLALLLDSSGSLTVLATQHSASSFKSRNLTQSAGRGSACPQPLKSLIAAIGVIERVAQRLWCLVRLAASAQATSAPLIYRRLLGTSIVSRWMKQSVADEANPKASI